MKLEIDKIPVSALTAGELKIYLELDDRVYGKDLSLRVTKKLLENIDDNGGLYHAHRDYCGLGLYVHKGLFTLGTVYDGRGPFPIVATFGSEADFVEWLSRQSDQSMALYGEQFNNQTIDRIRLEWFLDDGYSPIWNLFCEYVRERRTKERPSLEN